MKIFFYELSSPINRLLVSHKNYKHLIWCSALNLLLIKPELARDAHIQALNLLEAADFF